jgi:hypothetical protein
MFPQFQRILTLGVMSILVGLSPESTCATANRAPACG